MGATWSPTTGPSADVTSPPELTVPATTLQSDPDEQQSTEDNNNGVETHIYIIIALSVVVVALIVHTVHNKRKKHAPLSPDQPDTVTNPTYNAQQQSAPTVSGDVDDAYEVGQTLNPNYQPMLPERMRNRVYAEINLNVAGVPGHPDRQQDEHGYVAMHMPPTNDRHTNSSA